MAKRWKKVNPRFYAWAKAEALLEASDYPSNTKKTRPRRNEPVIYPQRCEQEPMFDPAFLEEIDLTGEYAAATYVNRTNAGDYVPTLFVFNTDDYEFEALADRGIIWQAVRENLTTKEIINGNGGVVLLFGRKGDRIMEMSIGRFLAICREAGVIENGRQAVEIAANYNMAQHALI